MKIFIFERIEQATEQWHAEGGLNIIADSKEHAIELINKEEHVEVTESEWEEVIELDLDDPQKYEPRIIVFQDAGCC